jgi:nucleoside-diphosphate-sugar epimerase
MFNLIQQLNRGLPFQINPFGITKSHVSVRNVVDVVLRFSDPSYSVNELEIYNLTERPYFDLKNMIRIICDELEVKPPKLNLPIWLVAVPFGILEFFGKLIKKDTGFTLDRLRKFSSSNNYTSEKLWFQTGNQKYSSESELRDMVKWFKERKK